MPHAIYAFVKTAFFDANLKRAGRSFYTRIILGWRMAKSVFWINTVQPLVMLGARPVRAVVSNDPEIEWREVSGIRPWVPATLEQQQYVDELMANRPSHS